MIRLFKRISAQFSAGFDSALNAIEDHDAIAKHNIDQLKKQAGRLRFRLQKVARDGIALEKQHENQSQAVTLWADRALRSAKEDRERGIECLRRKKNAEQQKQSLSNQIEEHKKLEQQLRHDFETLRQQIGRLERKRSTLSARETRSSAWHAISELSGGEAVEETFDRWEQKIMEAEPFGGELEDTIESEFVSEEARAELEIELDELISQN